MEIKEIMSHPPVTAPADSSADVVARLMWEFDCGIVPIVGNDGRLVGVITDRDICMAAYTQGKPLTQIVVASAMSRQVVACHVTDPVETAERLMRDCQIHRVPVVDSGDRLVGLVSMNDIARLAAHAKRSGVDREVVQTLAAICQPRVGTSAGANNTLPA
jgi:CBS domain-containing protein